MTTVRCSAQLFAMWRQLDQPQQLHLAFHRRFLCAPLTLNWFLFHAFLPFLLFSFQSFALFGFLPPTLVFVSSQPCLFLCPFLFTFFSYTLLSLSPFNHVFEPPGIASTMTRRRGASCDFGLITWLSDFQKPPISTTMDITFTSSWAGIDVVLVLGGSCGGGGGEGANGSCRGAYN